GRRALRRPARVDRQRGRRLPRPAARGGDRARPHSRGPRRSARRRGRRPPLRRRAHRLQVARACGRGPRLRGARPATRRGRGRGNDGRFLIALDEIRRAREVLRGVAVRTPLVRLYVDADAEIHLKLETLQPVSSFKIRGAANAILQADDDELAGGVVTASAGNMAQGVAWAARLRGVPATIVVPDHAPQTKLAAIDRLGGRVIKVPYDEWWKALVDGCYDGAKGLFVHPVDDERVMAGNGTIGLEVLEDLPDVDAVLVPYGGGGLVTGIGSV